MTATSVEHLLLKQTNKNNYNMGERESSSHLSSTDGQQADDMVSDQDLPLRLQLSAKVTGWPDQPLLLTKSRRATFLSIAIDSILLIFALLFLALAAGALIVSGRGIGDKSGKLVEAAAKLGPTVFPIVFAALTGRALKAIGRSRSEKGIEVSVGKEAKTLPFCISRHGRQLLMDSPIQTLWAFLSTKTAFDAFLLQWSAGAFSLPTILIGLLWALSPAGGQSSLRILYQTSQASFSSTNVRYMDTGPLGFLYTYHTLLEGYDLGVNSTDLPFSVTSSFAAALMQDVETKIGPRDSWGNPKIPRLDMLNHLAPDENGWVEVSHETTVESFGSLFGLPLLGVPDQGTVEFDVESAYVQLRPFSIEPIVDPKDGSWDLKVTCPTCIKTVRELFDGDVQQGRADQLLGPPWIQPNSTQMSRESFTNARLIQFEQSHFYTNLSAGIIQVLVETHIVCEDGSCKATKIRPSTTDHRPQNITAFDIWGAIALNILNQANRGNRFTSPTMLEIFMNKTSTIPVYRANAETMYDASFSNINLAYGDPDTLSKRGTLILNTAIHLLYSYYGFAGGLPSAETIDWGPAHVPADDLYAAAAAYNATPGKNLGTGDAERYVDSVVSSGAAFVAATAQASVARETDVYKANYTYIMVLVISSLVLTIIGLVGIATGLQTRAPDIFDPLMGLTYNNHSLGLPSPGTTLDADDRAKLLRVVRVRLGDVAGGEAIGMIGVGQASEVVPLVQGRLYE